MSCTCGKKVQGGSGRRGQISLPQRVPRVTGGYEIKTAVARRLKIERLQATARLQLQLIVLGAGKSWSRIGQGFNKAMGGGHGVCQQLHVIARFSLQQGNFWWER